MRYLRKNRLVKVIALAVILVFGSQQIGWADYIDLRDGAGFQDYAIAVAAGAFSGYTMNPSWNVVQVFAYTYLIPLAADQITKDIKNPYVRAATSAFISAAAVGGLDGKFTMDKIKDKSGKVLSREAASVAAREASNQAAMRIAHETMKYTTRAVIRGMITTGLAHAAAAVVGEYADQHGWWRGFGFLAKVVVAQAVQGGMESALGTKAQVSEEGPGYTEQESGGFFEGALAKLTDEQFMDTLKIETARVLIEELGIQAGLDEDLVTSVGAGISRVLSYKWRHIKEKSEEKIKECDMRIGELRQSGDQDSTEARNEIEHLSRQKEQLTESLKVTDTDLFFQGVEIGVISVGLQWLSKQTASPLHGAVFASAASAVAQAALIKEENLAQSYVKKEDQTKVQEAVYRSATGEEDISASIQRGDLDIKESLAPEKKGLWLYAEMLKHTITAANADWMSFGRATYKQTGPNTFDFDWTQGGGNDAFFAARYTDYAKQIRESGFGVALAYQYASAMHYQAVSNVRDIVSGDINRKLYVRDKSAGAKEYLALLKAEAALQQLKKSINDPELLRKITEGIKGLDIKADTPIKDIITQAERVIKDLKKEVAQIAPDKTQSEENQAKAEKLRKAEQAARALKALDKLQSSGSLIDQIRKHDSGLWWRGSAANLLNWVFPTELFKSSDSNVPAPGYLLPLLVVDRENEVEDKAKAGVNELAAALAPYLSAGERQGARDTIVDTIVAMSSYLKAQQESYPEFKILKVIYGDMYNLDAFGGIEGFRAKYGDKVLVMGALPASLRQQLLARQRNSIAQELFPVELAQVKQSEEQSGKIRQELQDTTVPGLMAEWLDGEIAQNKQQQADIAEELSDVSFEGGMRDFSEEKLAQARQTQADIAQELRDTTVAGTMLDSVENEYTQGKIDYETYTRAKEIYQAQLDQEIARVVNERGLPEEEATSARAVEIYQQQLDQRIARVVNERGLPEEEATSARAVEIYQQQLDQRISEEIDNRGLPQAQADAIRARQLYQKEVDESVDQTINDQAKQQAREVAGQRLSNQQTEITGAAVFETLSGQTVIRTAERHIKPQPTTWGQKFSLNKIIGGFKKIKSLLSFGVDYLKSLYGGYGDSLKTRLSSMEENAESGVADYFRGLYNNGKDYFSGFMNGLFQPGSQSPSPPVVNVPASKPAVLQPAVVEPPAEIKTTFPNYVPELPREPPNKPAAAPAEPPISVVGGPAPTVIEAVQPAASGATPNLVPPSTLESMPILDNDIMDLYYKTLPAGPADPKDVTIDPLKLSKTSIPKVEPKIETPKLESKPASQPSTPLASATQPEIKPTASAPAAKVEAVQPAASGATLFDINSLFTPPDRSAYLPEQSTPRLGPVREEAGKPADSPSSVTTISQINSQQPKAEELQQYQTRLNELYTMYPDQDNIQVRNEINDLTVKIETMAKQETPDAKPEPKLVVPSALSTVPESNPELDKLVQEMMSYQKLPADPNDITITVPRQVDGVKAKVTESKEPKSSLFGRFFKYFKERK